ncbi:MAG: hypothetical protein H7336_13925, partial [Bacteriovorax sp.]|nr:hypothetical protein [Bacteriovorax sp.]
MFKKIITLIAVSMSFSTFAGGDRVGNGGDVVVCKNSVELLDIYEARLNGHVLKNPEGQSYKGKLAHLLNKKLIPLQPERAKKYLGNLDTFESEAAFLPGIILNDVDDAGMVAIPKGCKLKQIIIQLSDSERPPGRKRYTVSLDLWNKLDDFNKMALVLHEIVYREAISYKASNSMIVRAFVGEIIRSDFDLKEFIALDLAFSESFEYKKTRIIQTYAPLAITFLQNEYKENTLQAVSNLQFVGEYAGEKFTLTSLTIRLSDEKILQGKMNNYSSIQYMRANESYEISPGVFFKASRTVDYKNGKLLSDNLYDLQVGYNTPAKLNLSFTQVKN